MQQFRNLLKGWFGKVLLVIFILPFAFFGIEGIFNSSGKRDLALTVNGAEITKLELSQEINNQRERFRQQMGGQIDPSMLPDDMLKPNAVESLIQRELLKQAVENEGLGASSELVKSYVRSMQQFQDEDGNFSNDRLETVLAQSNYTKAMLFNIVKESMVVEQLQKGISDSAFSTPAELEYLVKLRDQTRDAQYAILKVDSFKESVDVSDDKLREYFKEHQAQYRTEEQVKVQYVALSEADFAADIETSEDDLLLEYDDFVKRQKQYEQRRASHILVEINDDRSDKDALSRIKDAQKMIKEKSFEEAVKSYSDDIATVENGGDLDFVRKGDFDKTFEEALFKLEKPEDISDIVKSEFGYHIIKLTEVDALDIPSFEEKKESLKAQLNKQQAKEKLNEALDELGRLAFESGDLQVISEHYNKPIEISEFFTRMSGKGFAEEESVREVAFSDEILKEELNSEAIELKDGRIAVLRLKTHKPARDKKLDEVKDQVRDALVSQEALKMAEEKAKEMVAKVKEGESLESLSKSFGVEWKALKEITRQSSEPSTSAVAAIFELPRATEGKKSVSFVSSPLGDQEVVILDAVIEGQFDLKEKEKLAATLSSGSQMGQSDFANYLAILKEKAEIVTFD